MGGDIIKMSATSISCFKHCPKRYFYRYILGLAPVEDTDALRVGTSYHAVQELYDTPAGIPCECTNNTEADPNCILCEGSGVTLDDSMDIVVKHLNERYAVPPLSKTVEEWETEKITILYTLIGYRWWYQQQDKDYKVESLEQNFDIPLLSPITGVKLKGRLRGKIDRVFACGENRFVHDYKSTAKAIDPDSTFWSHLTLDTQSRLYTYAAAQLGLGMCGVLYDAWHKPGIKPKKLSQGDSKKFTETKEYCGEKFEIDVCELLSHDIYKVNGQQTEIKVGAKIGTYQIKETPQMFGARLLQDITNRPEFYFARKEVVHHSTSIEAFEWELFNVYHNIRSMTRHNRWTHHEHECEATFKCPFMDFCYNNIDVGPDEIPDNFTKRKR